MTKGRSLLFGFGVGFLVTMLSWGMVRLVRQPANLVRTQALTTRQETPTPSPSPTSSASPLPSAELPQAYGGPSAEELTNVVQGVVTTSPRTP